MLHGIAGAADGDRGIGVGAAGGVDQQRVALGVVLAILEMLRDVDEAAISGAACADGDDLEMMLEVVSSAAWIIFAPVSWCWPLFGQRDREHFAARLRPFMTTPGYFMVRREPILQSIHFTSAFFVREAALGDEIEDVRRPVLHGDVLDLRAFERDQLDHRAVQRGGVEFRRGAAFHVGQLRAFVANDERALELAEILGVDPEIGLERMLHFHARRHVDERAAAENRGVQRAEFVVAGRDHFAEPSSGKFPDVLSILRSSRQKSRPVRRPLS